MHTFLDESGSFTRIDGKARPSLVGALVIPTCVLPTLLEEYAALRRELPQSAGEVKGSRLSGHHIQAVIRMLVPYPVFFEATIADPGLWPIEKWKVRQQEQADLIVSGCGVDVSQVVMEKAIKEKALIESLPIQLYIQSSVTFDLIATALIHGMILFSHARPEELGDFNWIIDTKSGNGKKTPWEDWWFNLLPWAMNHISSKRFGGVLPTGDYSYMKPIRGGSSFGQSADFEIEHIFGNNVKFVSSKGEYGLELVDILANALRRALHGALDRKFWQEFPLLTVRRPSQCLRIYAPILREGDRAQMPVPYASVIRAFGQGVKLIPPPPRLR